MPERVNNFELDFCLCPCGAMDSHALLAQQAYNLGDKGGWFYSFRKGMSGFHSRIRGVSLHYAQVHAWEPRPRSHREPEYHLSSIFFHMDSAIECFTYALNSLGFGFAPAEFLDITSDKSLKLIQPSNITGTAKKGPLPGYGIIFPRLQALWLESGELIRKITELHDVSKHRSAIYVGGSGRNDPPPGFFEALGLAHTPENIRDYSPMGEIILPPDPKAPRREKTRVARYEDLDTLENLASNFCQFINGSVEAAARDALSKITFPHKDFLPRGSRVIASDLPLYADENCQEQRKDVVGILFGHEHIGFGVTSTSIRPTTHAGVLRSGMLLGVNDGTVNFQRKWGETWYRHPESGDIVKAWSSAAEYVPSLAISA